MYDVCKDKQTKWLGEGQHRSVHACQEFTSCWRCSAGNQPFICSSKVAICNDVSNWQLGISGSWHEPSPNNQFSPCKSEWPLQHSVPHGKGGVDLCWDKFGQGVHRAFRWLFLACSSCHLQTLHTINTSLSCSGSSLEPTVFHRVRKRREEGRQREKRKTGRRSCLEQQIEYQMSPGGLGILLTSATSQLCNHSSHFLYVGAVYTGGKGWD